MIKNMKGFASIETALSLITSLSVVVFFLTFIYTAVAKVWLHHITYEAVVCQAEAQPQATCELTLRKRGLWAQARLHLSKWQKSPHHWSLYVEWKLLKNIHLQTQAKILQSRLR